MIADLLKYHRMPLLLLLSCSALYFSIAYDLDRNDFPKLISLYLAISFLSWKLFQMEKFNLKFLIASCLLFRLIFLFYTPGLSQDFYRFLWDGHLMLQGVNPYLFTPEELTHSGFHVPLGSQLIQEMGSLSAGNHSNYPPLSQLLFALAALFSGKSVFGGILFLRLTLILSEVGIFIFGRKLLKIYGLPENRIFWFLLNPLVIIELTGNLHFEGLLIFFLLWSLYLIHRQKYAWAGVVFSLSVLVKLIPLLFLPLLLPLFPDSKRRLKMKKLLGFYSIVGLSCILGFLPFFSPGSFSNYLETVGLWFQRFEFNASVYYVVRWLGFQVKGYNIIETAGMWLGGVVFLGVMLLGIFFWRCETRDGAVGRVGPVARVRPVGRVGPVGADTQVRPYGMRGMFLGGCIFYLFATTVHPWYLAVPLVLCIFTRFRFMLVWSIVAFFSYSAYATTPVEENLWLVFIEYLLVFGYLGFESFKLMKRKSSLKH